MVMDPSRKNYPLGSKAALLTVAFIFLLLAFLSLKSVSAVSGDGKSFSEMKKRLGSRPPTCVHKCSNCRPCTATLVISHDDKKGRPRSAPKSFHDLEDDESYYLQTWKCKCGNKLFEP
ncbi:EPIDERMAL PATTERNING FACTOR-like protein 8 [Mangifera indica]|uniref:EPIDERMAL PATTERNING FACTOR-like protein 8 n=1 Tax=Mangifera indica TaxID=29780 RepID=UPI001CFA0581|nr:EPIDERMAL PATTERNING FACTOR-like protein 8 [Mangifera indica]